MDGMAARIRSTPEGFGRSLGDEALDRLAAYVHALLARARGLNLTAATDEASALDVLVRPSLFVAAAWTRPDPPRIALDLGSGNGFPGVVVAALWPRASVYLVERRRKKAHAISDCLTSVGFRNAEAFAFDVRELSREQPELEGFVDLVTVRAVGPLGATTRLAGNLLAPGGRIVHWKGADLEGAEREEGERVARAMGLACLPDVEHDDGRLVVYERPEILP